MKKIMSIAFATLMVAGITSVYAGSECTKDADKECSGEKKECPAKSECSADKA